MNVTQLTATPALRRGGVYRLPDGTECVAGVCGRAGGGFLYHIHVWREGKSVLEMPVAYEVCERGAVKTGHGRHTGWNVTNLVDTEVTLADFDSRGTQA